MIDAGRGTSRIAGLDELRGIAVTTVVLSHLVVLRSPEHVRWRPAHGALPWPLGADWWVIAAQLAVDLFFVMSGLLITGVLLRARGNPGSLSSFYLRRAARILPLALVCIAVSFAVDPATRDAVWAHLFFYVNYTLMLQHRGMTMLVHMWSLAVEEQFYVVYPLLVALIPLRRLWIAIGALAAGSAALRLFGHYAVWQGLYLSDYRTEVRIAGVLLGVWLALLQARLVPRPRWCAASFATLIAVLIAAGGRSGSLDAAGLALVVLPVWLAVTGRAVLRNRALAFLGVRCYGLYLLHLPVIALLNPRLPGMPAPLFFTVVLAITVALAVISFRFLESPLIAAAHSGQTSADQSTSRAAHRQVTADGDDLAQAP